MSRSLKDPANPKDELLGKSVAIDKPASLPFRACTLIVLFLTFGCPALAESPEVKTLSTGAVNDLRIAERWNGLRKYRKGACIERVKVKNKKKKGKSGVELLGGRILSAPSSHHFVCKKVATGKEPGPKYWFAVSHESETAFRLKPAVAKRAIIAFCEASERSLSSLSAGSRKFRQKRVAHIYRGRCN